MKLLQSLWLYLAFAMCGGVGAYLSQNRHSVSVYRKLSGLALMCVPLHMFEERIFPGGFHYIVSITSGGGQTQTNVMLMNTAVLVILTVLFIRRGDKPWFTAIMALLGIMECLTHTVSAISSYHLFHSAGMLIPYSPGYVVCIFLFLPLSIVQFLSLAKRRDCNWNNMKRTLLWLVIICIFTLALPNRLLHGIGEPFPDYGFYEAFLNVKD